MNMRFILTKDDGIDAPGLAALEAAVQAHFVVVAPRHPMSQVGHRITTHEPIHVERRGERRYAGVYEQRRASPGSDVEHCLAG